MRSKTVFACCPPQAIRRGTAAYTWAGRKRRKHAGAVGLAATLSPDGGRWVAGTDEGLVHIATEDGRLALVGHATAPVVAGGTLYLVSRKGQLHAFR